MTICLCHGGICELSIRCSWPKGPKGSAAYGREGFKGRAAGSRKRPMGATTCRQQHNQVSCLVAGFTTPPPPPQGGTRHNKWGADFKWGRGT
jgi:hypothetical protein